MFRKSLFLIAGLVFFFTPLISHAKSNGSADLSSYQWLEINADASWEARAGLQVVELKNDFYLMGGRTPRLPQFPPIPGDSVIYGDVWKSIDRGESWEKVLETDDQKHWPARAYFQAVRKDKYIYIVGGQNFKIEANECPDFVPNCPPFVSKSDFFNDVWRSINGTDWEQMTESAQWDGRAGLSSVVFKGHIYVMGGSFNDDPAVIGGPPTRVYFNDVWKSKNGRDWERLTDNAPWEPRAGAIVTVKNGYLYLLGGEDGFTCQPESPRCPPYFNDVWRSRDGAHWELVTKEANWPARPGHQVLVLLNQFVLFGGFGLSTDLQDPFKPSNPMDIWISKNGADWTQISESPWNAENPEEIKYDFDALVSSGGIFGQKPAIFTFGGDRETFDFTDQSNWLNVDNDVWRFSSDRF